MPGKRHLFIPGPTNIPEKVRIAMNLPMEDMRAPDFPDLVKPLLEDLKPVFRTRTGRVYVYPASGTGMWEAAMTNTLNPGDKVLMSTFGKFSVLWVDLAQRIGLEVEAIDRPWGEGVPVDLYRQALEADKAHAIKAVCVTHNETATGVTSDVQAARAALDDLGHPALLMVDGVSAIASIPFEMEGWGVDCAVSGSQKGLMLPAGLGVLGVSQKALEAHKSSKFRRCYFSFEDMEIAFAQGYFPYTPATQLLRGLRAAVDMLLDEGMEQVWARHHRLATGVRKAVAAWDGCELVAAGPEWVSDTVSAIRVPADIDAKEVLKTAYYRYDTSLGAGLDRLAGKVFRIGHLGDLNEVMLLGAIGAAEMAMKDCGAKIDFGAGAAAAQAHYVAARADAARAAA